METTIAATEKRQDSETTAGWMRLAQGGAATVVVWSVLLQLVAGTVIPPVAFLGVVFLGFLPFLRGQRRRLGLALAIVSVIAVVGDLATIVDELSHPESTPAFVLTLLATLGAVTALIGGSGMFFRWSAEPVRTFALGAGAIFLVGSMVSVLIGSNTDSDAALPGDISVTATQLEWTPTEITLDDSESGLWIDNQDGVRHVFVVEDLGIAVEIPGRKARRVDVSAVPGSYEIICTVPGHEEMTGTLVVGD